MATVGSTLLSPLFIFMLISSILGYRIQTDEETQKESHKVWALPGQPPVSYGQYAGYVHVGREKERALFYWFFEAEQKAEEKPLVLWLNGGPGCSSVAYGAAQELGPFLVRGNEPNLTLNLYSWNKVANVLFLESPIGVGFSYTNRTLDYKNLGDKITARDSYDFILSWLKRFPDFKSHDFYLAGESYAGHYVPQLAELIHDGNKKASKESYVNLKGFMIGNAVLNDEKDQMGMVEFAWSHAIISDELYNAVITDCNSFKDTKDGERIIKTCSPPLKAFLQAYSDIDIYSIYTPVCLSSYDDKFKKKHKLVTAPRLFSQHEQWHGMKWKMASGYDPCTEDYVEKYFNREDVQNALHANITGLPYSYSTCSQVIEKWNDSPSTILPILQKLLKAKLRIWVYSGDTDGRVPVTSTRLSINAMNLKAKTNNVKSTANKNGETWGGWRAWYYNKQVAGWAVEYEEGLTFATIRGAGHQVPAFAPDRALSLFSHFLDGKSLPMTRSEGKLV